MRVRLDESLPRGLKQELPEHDVATVPEAGWAGAKNEALLRLAEPRFDVFVAMDRHLPDQQNVSEPGLSVVVLRAMSNALPDLLPLAGPLRQPWPTRRWARL